MVTVPVSNVADHGLESLSGQTKDYKIGWFDLIFGV